MSSRPTRALVLRSLLLLVVSLTGRLWAADATDVERAAKRLRMQTYRQFRYDRTEYDRRIAPVDRELAAWRAKGSPASEADRLMEWIGSQERQLAGASRSGPSNGARPSQAGTRPASPTRIAPRVPPRNTDSADQPRETTGVPRTSLPRQRSAAKAAAPSPARIQKGDAPTVSPREPLISASPSSIDRSTPPSPPLDRAPPPLRSRVPRASRNAGDAAAREQPTKLPPLNARETDVAPPLDPPAGRSSTLLETPRRHIAPTPDNNGSLPPPTVSASNLIVRASDGPFAVAAPTDLRDPRPSDRSFGRRPKPTAPQRLPAPTLSTRERLQAAPVPLPNRKMPPSVATAPSLADTASPTRHPTPRRKPSRAPREFALSTRVRTVAEPAGPADDMPPSQVLTPVLEPLSSRIAVTPTVGPRIAPTPLPIPERPATAILVRLEVAAARDDLAHPLQQPLLPVPSATTVGPDVALHDVVPRTQLEPLASPADAFIQVRQRGALSGTIAELASQELSRGLSTALQSPALPDARVAPPTPAVPTRWMPDDSQATRVVPLRPGAPVMLPRREPLAESFPTNVPGSPRSMTAGSPRPTARPRTLLASTRVTVPRLPQAVPAETLNFQVLHARIRSYNLSRAALEEQLLADPSWNLQRMEATIDSCSQLLQQYRFLRLYYDASRQEGTSREEGTPSSVSSKGEAPDPMDSLLKLVEDRCAARSSQLVVLDEVLEDEATREERDRLAALARRIQAWSAESLPHVARDRGASSD